jgi:hypothetical protein
MIDLNDLDLTKPADVGYEFEYISESPDMPRGIFLTVLGEHSEKVKSWVKKELNRMRVKEAMRAKRGKEEPRTVEDDQEFSNGSAAIRVISWRGISGDCTYENAIKLCSINSEIKEQIFKASGELGNFTKSKSIS